MSLKVNLQHVIHKNQMILVSSEGKEIEVEIMSKVELLLVCYGRDNPHDIFYIESNDLMYELEYAISQAPCRLLISDTEPVLASIVGLFAEQIVWSIPEDEFYSFLGTHYDIFLTQFKTIWQKEGF